MHPFEAFQPGQAVQVGGFPLVVRNVEIESTFGDALTVVRVEFLVDLAAQVPSVTLPLDTRSVAPLLVRGPRKLLTTS